MKKKPLFDLGILLFTPGTKRLLASGEPLFVMVLKHAIGNWGNLCDEDKASNNRAVKEGGRIMSSYPLADGGNVWVVTEADRSATTVLLPSEY